MTDNEKANIGVIAMGLKAPIIKEGDNLVDIAVETLLKATKKTNPWEYYDIDDNDVFGITESVVARATGNYVTVDEIAAEIKEKYNNPQVIFVNRPIYSRNRFSMILKAIARAATKRVVMIMPDYDEVGNPSGVNPWTGVDIKEYYRTIIENEGCEARFEKSEFEIPLGFYGPDETNIVIYCGLHDYEAWKKDFKMFKNYTTLADICSDRCDWGLLGSNKATEEKLKLFPKKEVAQKIVNEIRDRIFNVTKKHIHVMCYGDGGFKDPVAKIWECADPCVSPAYTEGLEGSPNEIKIKAFADDQFAHLSGDELTEAIKDAIRNRDANLKGSMDSQGTTPRRYTDLLGSLMDLLSGSGSRGCPFCFIKYYFNNFAD